MSDGRVIFHIDMNSYFASVAQQANPFLVGKPIGVGGKPGTRGIIAAASREAKKRGVKTAMNAYEALRICPELEIVDGDPGAYEHITEDFLRIFRRYTDAVEVFSIDEAFLDVTGWHARWGGPEALAKRIKADMRREIGERITCSIGIASTKILAKLASDMKKPDGLVRIRREDVSIVLAFSEITDICGLAERMRRRLATIGIHDLIDLGLAPITRLTVTFGPVMGAKLWLLGRGEDLSTVAQEENDPKSFGNSYTLPEDTVNPRVMRETLAKLCEKACRRMRAEGYLAGNVSAFVRYSDFSHGGDGTRLGEPTDDPLPVLEAAWKCVLPHICRSGVRMLGIQLHDLSPDNGQLRLWPEDGARRRRLLHALDAVNARYGHDSLHSAATTGVKLKRHVSGFKYGTGVMKRKV